MMRIAFPCLAIAAAAAALPGMAIGQAPKAPLPAGTPVPPDVGGIVTGVGYYAVDFERSLRFYREGLGMIELLRLPQRDGDEVILSFTRRTDATNILLLHRPPGKAPPPAAEGKIVLAVPNAEALAARLKAAGYAPGPITSKPERGVKIFWISDPDGNRIEVIERAIVAPPRP